MSIPTIPLFEFTWMKKRVRTRDTGKDTIASMTAVVTSHPLGSMMPSRRTDYKRNDFPERRIISSREPTAMRIPMATFDHPFLPNAGEAIRKMMLEAIGVASIEELYSDIPVQVRTNRSLKVDWLPSEQEVKSHVDRVLGENKSARDMPIFLGAGIYNHYLPAARKSILSRTEFQTSYTPYQAEISQGLLQSLFEFQSMIADLTQMDAVNSSLYDGSTALGEAARMACRATGRKKILVPHGMHPSKFSVLENYTEPVGIRLETFLFDKETGGLDSTDLPSKIY